MIATGASGFGIMALIAGTERGFISRKESVERFTRIVNFIEKADKYHGAVAHFIDGKTGKTEPFFGKRDNGADLVETSFFVQGLLAAHQYFNKDNAEEKISDKKSTSSGKESSGTGSNKRQIANFSTGIGRPTRLGQSITV
jgi:hypothetical protein